MAKKIYAVKSGKDGVNGIYFTWEECRSQVDGVSGARYKGFSTMEEARAFLEGEEISAEQGGQEDIPVPKDEASAIAYVDGSYLASTGEFSCGAVLFYDGKKEEISRRFHREDLAEMHNVAGEIMGAVTVIRRCAELGLSEVEIYHDYAGVAKWATGEWKANKPGTQAYAAFCQKARQRIKLSFVKVKGHSGDRWNERADELAKAALGI